MVRTKTDRLLGSMKPKKQPIADNFILPNTSGDHVRSIKRAVPVDDADLVNKKYVDDQNTLYVPITGGTFTGQIFFDAPVTGLDVLRSVNISINLDVGQDLDVGRNIIVGGTVDGVDIATALTNHPHQNVKTTATPKFVELDLEKTLGINAGLWLKIKDVGTAKDIKIGLYRGGANALPGIWLNAAVPDFSNYAFLGSNTNGTIFNTPSGQEMAFRIANSPKMSLKPSGGVAIGSTYGSHISGTDPGADNVIIQGDLGVGTNAPTQPFSVKEKASMTAIGGFAIKLTNLTGANSVKGEVVRTRGTAADDAVTLALTGELDAIGIFLESGVAHQAEAWVVVSGIADVLADNTGFVRGDRLVTGTGAGNIARGTANNAPSVAVHFQEIGHAIETAAANTLGRTVLHFL